MAPQLGDTEDTEAHSNGICRRNRTRLSAARRLPAKCGIVGAESRRRGSCGCVPVQGAGSEGARRKRPSPGSRLGANASRRDRSTVTCGRLEHPRRRPRCRSDSLRLGTRSGRPLSASPNMPVASDKNSIFSLYRMFYRQIRLLPTSYLRHVFYIRHASWTKCNSVDSSSGSSSVTTLGLCLRHMTPKNVSRRSKEYKMYALPCRSRGIQ